MTFHKMRKKLIDDGLLDPNGKLTPKGHEYVEGIKTEYRTKTVDAEIKIRKNEEKIAWPTKWT